MNIWFKSLYCRYVTQLWRPLADASDLATDPMNKKRLMTLILINVACMNVNSKGGYKRF